MTPVGRAAHKYHREVDPTRTVCRRDLLHHRQSISVCLDHAPDASYLQYRQGLPYLPTSRGTSRCFSACPDLTSTLTSTRRAPVPEQMTCPDCSTSNVADGDAGLAPAAGCADLAWTVALRERGEPVEHRPVQLGPFLSVLCLAGPARAEFGPPGSGRRVPVLISVACLLPEVSSASRDHSYSPGYLSTWLPGTAHSRDDHKSHQPRAASQHRPPGSVGQVCLQHPPIFN